MRPRQVARPPPETTYPRFPSESGGPCRYGLGQARSLTCPMSWRASYQGRGWAAQLEAYCPGSGARYQEFSAVSGERWAESSRRQRTAELEGRPTPQRFKANWGMDNL